MIELLITIAIVGVIVYLIVTFIPMPQPFKTAIVIVACLCVAIYVLQAFGLWHHGGDIPVPNLR